MICYILARFERFKVFRKFFCKIGWHCHSDEYEFVEQYGINTHARCKWCGYEGIIDSQGNLF